MNKSMCASINGCLVSISHDCAIKNYDSAEKDILTALTSLKTSIIEDIIQQQEKFKSLKWYVAVKAKFVKTANNEEIASVPTFHGKTRTLMPSDNVEIQFMESLEKILDSIEKYVRDGSGWTLDKIVKADLCMVKYRPMYASSFIQTPKKLAVTKSVINIKNEKDEKCYLWSIIAALYPNKNNRVSDLKKYESSIVMEGIDYPVKLDDIGKFEEQNAQISINVFGYQSDLYPLRVTKLKNRKHHINLLYLTNSEGNSHYCLITNFSRLMAHQTSYQHKFSYCNYCLKRFQNETSLKDHSSTCIPVNISELSLPATSTKHVSSYIPTPKNISHGNKSIINITNLNDEKCFLWSILGAVHKGNPTVCYLRQFENTINMDGIEYPVDVKSLDKFEKLNTTLSVNVFGCEKEEIYPIRITKEKNRNMHVNLLLLNSVDGKKHYCLVGDLSSLLSNLTKHEHKRFYCNYCLHRFSTNDLLSEHEPLCTPHGAQKTKLPTEKEKYMYFKNYTLTHKVPFTVYCDFESFNVPIQTCTQDENKSSNINKSMHIPSGFCYVIIDSEGKVIKHPIVYSGPDVVDTFLNSLLNESKELLPILYKNTPMKMTLEDKINFQHATICHLCKTPLNDDKVANHNHLNGDYLGPAHNSCNLNYQVPKHIPVFFHNLKGYDCHHLMQGFGKFKKEKMSCIATTSERYISVTLNSLRFLDSLQFLNSSLETLVSNLAAEGPSKFKILKQCMGEEKIDLLLRKGVFPYAWLTNESKLAETCLPSKRSFYNNLTETEINDKDYEHAQNMWNSFKMTTMKEYHDLYLKTDVLLLADIFEHFRATSLEYYEIDPCNVYSAPGLAWNAMLKMTDVKLELLTDIDQHLFVESGIRGGVAMIPNRYANANNHLLPGYDNTKPINYLIYFDCTNLYGTAMVQFLPKSNFRWLSKEESEEIKVKDVPDDNETGYILEVDLGYPDHLHDLHSDYPLAPLRQQINSGMLSPYCQELQKELNYGEEKVEKLVTTLHDKEKYVLHYRNLKLYLELGLVLKKIHRVLAFTQDAWLAPFINFNTEKRKLSKNSFEKDFFKLMNNATYGKSLENVRSRIDFKLVANEKQLLKWTASPRLKTFFAYNEDLAGLSLKKQTILLNRPIYVGFSVLDISKLIMYKFHYEWAINKYGKNIKLCMTDTDSLLYNITTPDVYADIKENLHLFDTSDYPYDHFCHSQDNKKKLGTFKDEMNSKPIREFIGLRAKCYSVLCYDKEEKRVAKGVPRTAIKRKLTHDQYKRCLLDHTMKFTTSTSIRSDRHQLFTQEISKLSLSPYDNKRYILENGMDTVAYGHKRTRSQGKKEDTSPAKKKKEA